MAITGTLRTLQHAVPSNSAQRKGNAGGKRGGRSGARSTQMVHDDGDMDMDDVGASEQDMPPADADVQALHVLSNINSVLRKHRLSDNTDALANVSEAAAALLFANPTMPSMFAVCAMWVHSMHTASCVDDCRCIRLGFVFFSHMMVITSYMIHPIQHTNHSNPITTTPSCT